MRSRIKFRGHREELEGIAYLFGEGDRYVLVLHETVLESTCVCNLFELACASACARFEVSPTSIKQFMYIGMRISLAPFHWNGVAFALKEDGLGPWP